MINTNYKDDITFMLEHVGGKNDDTKAQFIQEKDITYNQSISDYERLINLNNDLERKKNENTDYVEKLDNELHTTVYRINNFATTVDDIVYSNPIIYPKDYDPYFDYLFKKNINPINNQVVKSKKYVNIDSNNRNIKTSVTYDSLITLETNSILFFSNKNYFRINLNNANNYFSQNDYLTLRGFKNYSINYTKINFFFTNNSPIVVLDLKPNFDYIIPYYDICILISGVTNLNKDYYKNIPLNLINQIHKVFVYNNDNDSRLAFNLPINFYTDNNSDKTLISDCTLTYYNVGNYPINLINAYSPTDDTNLIPYFIVQNVTDNYIQLKLTNILSVNQNIQLIGTWNKNVFYTGENIQIAKIITFSKGDSEPNSYTIILDQKYNNVCSIKMISSEIPNVQENINNNVSTINTNTNNNKNNVNLQINVEVYNNKLYWQNILDNGIYSISLDQGYYTYSELKITIEKKVSEVKRNLIFSNNNLYEYNIMTVNFDTFNNISSFNMFDIYILPNCLFSIISDDINNIYIIRINQNQHNLLLGSKIFITGSINYYFIDKNYINNPNGHKITNVINNNFYEITITNINKIIDVGDTKGGNQIQIKTSAIFKLYFNYNDTFGSLIGFNSTGSYYSITPYCSELNNYTIRNTDDYYINTNKILVINNEASATDLITDFQDNSFKYILLQLENFNLNSNPNSIPYFYKILLNGSPNTYLYNTFVNTPAYIYPPVKTISQLKFTFLDPQGNLVNFYNQSHSFTLEFTCFNNFPDNTNKTSFTSRL